MSTNAFVEGRLLPGSTDRLDPPHFPFAHQHDYQWAEQLYHSGDIVAVVALYKNIPQYLQKELDRLVTETYRKKLLSIPFLEASLLLLASGVLPEFEALRERSQHICPESGLADEQQKAIEFVTCRNPNEIVVMVLRSDRLIATFTLFPFNKSRDIPSLSYLEIDPAIKKMPDVPAIEVGRLAIISCNGQLIDKFENSFIDMASLAPAFLVSERFTSKTGMLRHPQSFICGDTHGTLITTLKRIYPLTVINSRINPRMLKDQGGARGMSIYFIQRQVLGAFESAEDLLAAIEHVAESDSDLAHRIKMHLDSGLATLGVSSIHQFDPNKFRVSFFKFPFHHPKTLKGLVRMEQMMHWMAGRKRLLH